MPFWIWFGVFVATYETGIFLDSHAIALPEPTWVFVLEDVTDFLTVSFLVIP